MRMGRQRVTWLLAALALAGAAAFALPADGAPRKLRVLFVGNSLTAANDLPAFVAALARSSGRTLEYGIVAYGGFSLEDHWQLGEARRALEAGDWNVVVMQQGPSTYRESEASLRLWATRFADLARTVGTTPALLAVWPDTLRRDLPAVIGSYARSARAARAQLVPAGGAWQAAWRCNARLPLHGPDSFHPSPLGTYVAALAVYGRLFRAPVRGLPASLRRYGVAFATPSRTARLVQAAATVALGRRLAAGARCGR